MQSPQRVSAYHWLVLFVAWLGWVFDSMDSTIYALVLQPALNELLRIQSPAGVTQEAIASYGGIIFSIFLIGWALGGIGFGALADRFGRTRVLVWTILVYAVFTGLAALSQSWWQLALFRFITALGIGGEWAAGAALVAEVWPESQRTRAAGWLQSAWAAGFLLAALITLILKHAGWRANFLVGIGPAVVALLVRLCVREPERWIKVSKSEPAERSSRRALAALFTSVQLRSTLVGTGLAFVAVFGLWGATNWTPTLIRSLPDVARADSAAAAKAVGYATMLLNVGAFAGYLSFGPIAEKFGRRPAFALMCLGSFVMLPVNFLLAHSYLEVVVLLPILGFFNNGIFTGFAIYFPELFPTAIRAMGAGFCFNAGRILAASGPFLTGYLVTVLGTFGRAASCIAIVYLAGLLILLFAPETKGRPLPD